MSVKIVSLSEVSEQVRGVSYSKGDACDEPRDGYLPILRANNITDAGLTFDDLIYIPPSKVSEKQRIKKGDIVIAASSGSLDVVGKAAPVLKPFTGSFGAFCKVVRPNEKVYPGYLAHFFTTPEYRHRISNLAAGANINNLRNEHLATLQIPLPPLEGQKRLAAILDKADAIRRKRRESLRLADQFLRSVFLDMFGDPVTNPKGWKLILLTNVGKFISGGTPNKRSGRYWNGEFPWVSPKDMKVPYITDSQDHISDLVFRETSLKKIQEGNLLIVVRGMILAHSIPTAINRVPVAINQDMKAIIPYPGLSAVFLKACLDCLTSKILSLVSTASHGTKRFDVENMKKVLIPIPPEALQAHFERIVRELDDEISVAQEQALFADVLFESLQQRAFVAEI